MERDDRNQREKGRKRHVRPAPVGRQGMELGGAGQVQVHRPREHAQERGRRQQRLLHGHVHERDRLQEPGQDQDGRGRSRQAVCGRGHHHDGRRKERPANPGSPAAYALLRHDGQPPRPGTPPRDISAQGILHQWRDEDRESGQEVRDVLLPSPS